MRTVAALLAAAVLAASVWAQAQNPAASLSALFMREVDKRLEVPESEQQFYAQALQRSLTQAGSRADWLTP